MPSPDGGSRHRGGVVSILHVELLQTDLGVLGMLVAGLVASGIAIAADYAPERRRKRSMTRTEPLP